MQVFRPKGPERYGLPAQRDLLQNVRAEMGYGAGYLKTAPHSLTKGNDPTVTEQARERSLPSGWIAWLKRNSRICSPDSEKVLIVATYSCM